MSKHRIRIVITIIVTLAAVACLALLAGAYTVFGLPARAARTFGPPAPHLDTVQHIRLSAQLLLQADSLITPANPSGTPQPFKVVLGETLPSIARRLQSEGLIHDAGTFRVYLQYSGLDTTLQAGDYQLSPAMTPLEIAQELQDATPGIITFTILPGWRLEEVAATVPTSGLEFSPEDFLTACHSRPEGYAFLGDLPDGVSLEGFLFPGSYQLPRELSAAEVVTVLLDNFAANLSTEIQAGFNRQGLNIYEAVILASIVQRESVLVDEMPLIASVFLNRLMIGMQLEADSTAQYAIGYNETQKTWWTNPLSRGDLQFDSQYNTYRYPGLPPGPIANPGLEALRAVAFPAQTPYYYFRATCDHSGRHLFAETFEQHLMNACE
jgi:UPF0755 protein